MDQSPKKKRKRAKAAKSGKAAKRKTKPAKRRVSRKGKPRAPRRDATDEPRFVRIELLVEATSARRVLEARARYSLSLVDTAGREIEELPVMRARVTKDRVEFRGRPPYGFAPRATESPASSAASRSAAASTSATSATTPNAASRRG